MSIGLSPIGVDPIGVVPATDPSFEVGPSFKVPKPQNEMLMSVKDSEFKLLKAVNEFSVDE